jgi:hypothetical protein
MVLVSLGNGLYNRDGILVDYNGKQGHHPKGCDCVKGHINKVAPVIIPQTITKGVNPVANEQTLTFEQFQQQQAYNAYLASNGNPPIAPNEFNPLPTPDSIPTNLPPVNPIAVPVAINPVVPTFVAGQNEYVIPINVTLPKKGMAQITDARMHTEPKFTDGIHDFRFSKGYATRAIVSNGVWELVLRRKA